MSTSFKAQVIMRSIKDGIKKRLPAYFYTDGLDTAGNPCLLVSVDATPATTEQVAMIRVRPAALVFTNGIGGTQENMAPHFVDVLSEATAASATVSRLTAVNATYVMGEVLKQACLTSVYLTASGTVPALADVDTQAVDANKVASFETEIQYRLGGN